MLLLLWYSSYASDPGVRGVRFIADGRGNSLLFVAGGWCLSDLPQATLLGVVLFATALAYLVVGTNNDIITLHPGIIFD